jgi:hypothetical protein
MRKDAGTLMGAANLGVCIEPVRGGWVALGSGGYEWVFLSLAIFAAMNILAIGWTFPETARNVVGDGNIDPGTWGKTWLSVFGLWFVGRKEGNWPWKMEEIWKSPGKSGKNRLHC